MLLFICLRGEHAAMQPLLSSNVRTIAVIVACRVILNLRHVAGGPQAMSLDTFTSPPREEDNSEEAGEHEEAAHSTGLEFARSVEWGP